MRKKQKIRSNKFDRGLLLLTLILVISGLLVLTDASAPLAQREFNDKFFFVKQQALWAIIGIVAMLVLSKVDFKFWNRLAVIIFSVAFASLFLVFIPGIGTELLGAKRWVIIGNFSFQPSEFVKLAIVIYMSKLASKNKKPLSFFLPILLVGGVIMLQPDLGTTMVVLTISMAQIFVSGINIIYFLGAGLSVSIISLVLIITSDYRRDRLLTFLQQTEDPLGKGYHIRQILYALGAGGFFGVGLGQSLQKYLFLPETATDSIFAIIAEETGFLGASLIIFIFGILTLKIIKIAKTSPDTFSKIFAVGIASWVGGQTFLNIGSMVSLVPLTGIPLPFFSYGGNALVSLLSGIGILLNISKHTKEDERKA